MNHKRVQRIWRREGLKVPSKQPKRARLWLNDGSCIRLRPEHKDHVWAYDFVHHRTHDGRSMRLLTIVDEYTRESLAIDVARKLNSEHVLERLGWLFVHRGIPEHIRSDNDPEFTAEAVRDIVRVVPSRPVGARHHELGFLEVIGTSRQIRTHGPDGHNPSFLAHGFPCQGHWTP